MPSPSPDFDLVTILWRAANDKGEAQVGSLRVVPNITRSLVDPHASTPIGVYLVPRTVQIAPSQVTVDSVQYNVGVASFQLLASNDPDIVTDPDDYFTYTITEVLSNGATGETYSLFVDKDAPAATINLQTIDRGTPPSTPLTPVSVVTIAAFTSLEDRVATLELTGGGSGTVTSVNSITPTSGNVPLNADDIPALDDQAAASDVQAELDRLQAEKAAASITADDLPADDDEESPSTVQAELDRLQAEKSDTTHTHTGVIALSRAAVGTVFAVLWDGANWKDAAGTTITARPSARTDLVMMAIGNTTPPAFAIDGKDIHLAQGA